MADSAAPAGARRRMIARLGLLGARSALLLVALALGVAALHRAQIAWDLTPMRRFSVRPELQELLAGLDHPVDLVLVWDPAQHAQASYIRDHLERIAAQTPRLHLREIHAVRDQPRLDLLAQRLGAPPLRASLYALRPERPAFRLPLHPGSIHTLQRDLAGALINLRQDDPTPIYVLQGHGELPASDEGPEGCSRLLAYLRLGGYRVELLDPARLLGPAPAPSAEPVDGAPDAAPDAEPVDAPPPAGGLGRIPKDGILLLPAPRASLGARTRAMIREFLVDGGRMLVLADRRIPPGLRALLRDWSLDVGDPHREPGAPAAIVRSLDAALRLPGRPFDVLLLGSDYGLNADGETARQITGAAAATGQRVASPLSSVAHAASWEALGPEEIEQQREAGFAVPLGRTRLLSVLSGDAWVAPADERSVPADLAERPPAHIPLAWAVVYEPHPRSVNPQRTTRVVLWASRMAGANRWVGGDRYANNLLLASMVGWLAEGGPALTIPRQRFTRYRLEASPALIWWLKVLLVALLPSLCVGAAILAWWERR